MSGDYSLEEMLTPEALDAGVDAYLEWQDSSDYVNRNLVRQIILAVTSRALASRSGHAPSGPKTSP